MILDDVILGKPIKLYINTRANIEALTGVTAGEIAYASDISSVGQYNGSAWQWIGILSSGSLALEGHALTVPSTGTAALLEVANNFTQRISVQTPNGVGYLLVGTSTDSTSDNSNGVAIVLTHNASGNRQFAIGDSLGQIGLRIVPQSSYTTLDGYNWGTNGNLPLNINHNVAIGAGYYNVPTSTLLVYGSFATQLTVISTNTTLGASHQIAVVSNGSTITLPTAVGISGRQYNIIRSGTSNVLINTTSSQTISGDLTLTLTNQWDSVVVVSDNTNWVRCS